MSGNLPQWLADWLSIPSTADAATWQLESAWRWPPWATLLLIVAVIAFTVMLYVRESSSAGPWYRALLAGLRGAAIILVLIMLAQWVLAVRLTGRPNIVLIIDRSASMAIADRYDLQELPPIIRERLLASGLSEPTRLNLAKLLTISDDAKLLQTLADRWRLQVYFVDSRAERAENARDVPALQASIHGLSTNAPGSGATRLGDAVRQVLGEFRGEPPTAIILLTDGVTTEGVPLDDAAQHARRAGVPLFAVGLGSSRPPRDIELADVLVDDAVFVNDLVSVQVQVKATGLDAQSATVTLKREGMDAPVATQDIALSVAGHSTTVQLVDRPTEPGEISYVIEIAPRDDETNRENNRQTRKVAVRDEKIRVLMVQGYPNYEFRFLKSLLGRDRTIQLFTYLQDADPEYAAQDKTALPRLPINRDELFKYDVLILGDVDPRLATSSLWQHLRAFVTEKGGGVAFIAGPRFFPWLYADVSDVNALLPFDADAIARVDNNALPGEVSRGFQVEPTPFGFQHPALQLGNTLAETRRIWKDLTPLYWFCEVNRLKPAAQVLAKSAIRNRQSAIPLISFQYVGAGRVLFHAIDATWRWRLGAGDKYFARYWVQSIRFLARGKLSSDQGVQLTSDRRLYTLGDVIELRARFFNGRFAPQGNEVALVVESTGKTRRRLTLHRNPAAENVFAGTFSDFKQGEYDVTLAETQIPGTVPELRLKVVNPPGELARPIMDAAALTAAAQTTRGKFYTIAAADQLIGDLPTGRRVPLENLPPFPIWNRWWLLAAFLICLSTEWFLRKRKGML